MTRREYEQWKRELEVQIRVCFWGGILWVILLGWTIIGLVPAFQLLYRYKKAKSALKDLENEGYQQENYERNNIPIPLNPLDRSYESFKDDSIFHVDRPYSLPDVEFWKPIQKYCWKPIQKYWELILIGIFLISFLFLTVFTYMAIFSPTSISNHISDDFHPSPSSSSVVDVSNTDPPISGMEVDCYRFNEHIIVGTSAYTCNVESPVNLKYSYLRSVEVEWVDTNGRIQKPRRPSAPIPASPSLGNYGYFFNVDAPDSPGRYILTISFTFEGPGEEPETTEVTARSVERVTIYTESQMLEYQYRSLIYPLQSLVTLLVLISIIQCITMLKNRYDTKK